MNVDRKTPWPSVDLIVFKSMDVAFNESLDHDIAEHASADYSTMRPNENLYFVGHGSPGKIGAADPKTIATRLNDSKVGLPNGYHGDIVATSCSAGRPKPGEPGSSGTNQLALGVDQRHAGLNITGARGPSLRHITTGTRVIDPARTDAARTYQDTHTVDDGTGPKTLGQLKADFETWKTNNSGFTAREGSAKATGMTMTFMDDFITHAAAQNWLLPRGTGAGQDTELVHPSAQSFGAKVKSAFSWLGV